MAAAGKDTKGHQQELYDIMMILVLSRLVNINGDEIVNFGQKMASIMLI